MILKKNQLCSLEAQQSQVHTAGLQNNVASQFVEEVQTGLKAEFSSLLQQKHKGHGECQKTG